MSRHARRRRYRRRRAEQRAFARWWRMASDPASGSFVLAAIRVEAWRTYMERLAQGLLYGFASVTGERPTPYGPSIFRPMYRSWSVYRHGLR